MIKFELAMIDRTKFMFIKTFYISCIKPIFSGILIIFKYILVIPFGCILMKLFPAFVQKTQEEKQKSQ